MLEHHNHQIGTGHIYAHTSPRSEPVQGFVGPVP